MRELLSEQGSIYVHVDWHISHYLKLLLDDIFDNANVKQKQKSALDWCKKINELEPNNRMNATWHYSLLDDNTFYSMKNKNASTKECLNIANLQTVK